MVYILRTYCVAEKLISSVYRSVQLINHVGCNVNDTTFKEAHPLAITVPTFLTFSPFPLLHSFCYKDILLSYVHTILKIVSEVMHLALKNQVQSRFSSKSQVIFFNHPRECSCYSSIIYPNMPFLLSKLWQIKLDHDVDILVLMRALMDYIFSTCQCKLVVRVIFESLRQLFSLSPPWSSREKPNWLFYTSYIWFKLHAC